MAARRGRMAIASNPKAIAVAAGLAVRKFCKTVRCPGSLPCTISDLDPRIDLAVGYSRGS